MHPKMLLNYNVAMMLTAIALKIGQYVILHLGCAQNAHTTIWVSVHIMLWFALQGDAGIVSMRLIQTVLVPMRRSQETMKPYSATWRVAVVSNVPQRTRRYVEQARSAITP